MINFPLRRHWIGSIRLAFTLLGLPQTLCTSGLRTAISCSPSQPFPIIKTTRTISNSYCRLYTTMPSSAGPHVKSRCPQYPGSNIKRFPVPNDKVDWAQQWPQYDPVCYTAPLVLNKPAWADPDIGSFSPQFNTVDDVVDRTSFEGSYKVENGKPLNPRGRTGLTGRGLLGRWGPNHAADPVVTRWKVDAKGVKMHHTVSKQPILQFVSIKRKDCGEWAIPGGMVDPGEQVSLTLQREFSEEALNSLSVSPEERAKIQARITNLFKLSGFEVYKGYVDDPRNTDNAWMETVAVNFHDDLVLGSLQSVMQDLHSDDDDDSEDDNDDMDSDTDRATHAHLTHHQRRVSLSDGSENDSSSHSTPSCNEAPPLLKTTNNQILEVKSPTKQSKQDKTKTMECDKAYLDELVELHKRLMTLREGHILQQIVNLIEETGHFHITNTTFDFDLCSLDRSTVRKLQSYLETSGLS